eukprot:jgi/Chlat1/8420/Chrsp80S07837
MAAGGGGGAEARRSTISVVIPALNEAEGVGRAIDSARDGGAALEVIVVDGGSADATAAVAAAHKATVLAGVGRGRALQMNAGAAAAKGDTLLFLHADSALPNGWSACVRSAMDEQPTSPSSSSLSLPLSSSAFGRRRKRTWGAFEAMRLEVDGWGFRMVEAGARLRTLLLGLPYGDQALFVDSEAFKAIGGYDERLALMEDYQLVHRLRHTFGRPALVPSNKPVLTSARRWLQHGIVRTTVMNQFIITAYWLGVPTSTLAQWYRNAAPRKAV